MPKLAAVDWDNQEMRYASAVAAGGRLRQVDCVAVRWDAAEQAGLTAGSLEAAQYLLERTGVSGARGTVVARREHIERFHFTVPPAKDEELPELIENHLAVENSFGTDELAYGYVALDGTSDEPRRLSVVAMPRQLAEEYRQLAAQVRLKRPKLVLRPAGMAALLQHLELATTEPTLLVVPLAEEMDLALTSSGTLWYWRTIYSAPAGGSPSFDDFLSAEIARTIAVAGEELPPDVRVERIVVLGESGHDEFVQALQSAVSLPVVVASPVPDGVRVTCEGEDAPAGKFAPLLGLLAGEASGQQPPVDLLRTTRRVTSKSRKRPMVTAVVGAGIAVLLGAFWAWDGVHQVQMEADRLSAEHKKLQAVAEKLEADAATADALQNWQDSSIVWLDELRDLTVRFPPPGAAVVLDFAANSDRSGGAVIQLNGKAREPSVVTILDQTLSDEFRDVLSRNFREESSSAEGSFLWRFQSVMTTRRRSPREYRAAEPQSRRAAEPQSGRAAERQSGRAEEQKSSRAAERQSGRAVERT